MKEKRAKALRPRITLRPSTKADPTNAHVRRSLLRAGMLALALYCPQLLSAQETSAPDAAKAINSANKITDLLDARWFEVELIVFERLEVLDFNTPETLTKSAIRTWPNNLTQLGAKLSTAEALFDVARSQVLSPESTVANRYQLDFTQPSRHCLGYPMWAEEDPIHPSLLPTNSFFDTADGQVIEELPDTLDSPEDSGENELSAVPTNLPMNQPRLEPTLAQKFLEKIDLFEAHLQATSLHQLDTHMTNDVKAINRQRHLRPLMHIRWRQPVPARDAALPIHVSTKVTANSPANLLGLAKIEGFIEVTVARYLHFSPTLWYHSDTLGQAPIALPVAENLQHALANTLPRPHPERYMQLSQSRRMRSDTLHYMDHPKMGVLVKIDPIAIPEELEQELAQLKEISTAGG